MPKLTPMQMRALRWLGPGTWRQPAPPVVKGLRSLANHHPDLVEVSLRQTKYGPVAEYRLTEQGERMRAGLKGRPSVGS